MGLLEKRAVKDFQEKKLDDLIKEINQLAYFDVEFEFDWDSLMVDDYAHLYEEGYTKVFFETIKSSFKEITSDELGREGLKSILKKIVIKNSNDNYSSSQCFSLENGVLTFDHSPTTNIDQTEDRAHALSDLLMKKM